MTSGTAIGDPVQAGCSAGRQARAADGAAGRPAADRAALLLRADAALAMLAKVLSGSPHHDPLIVRERFLWAFVLGYEEAFVARSPRARAYRRRVRRGSVAVSGALPRVRHA